MSGRLAIITDQIMITSDAGNCPASSLGPNIFINPYRIHPYGRMGKGRSDQPELQANKTGGIPGSPVNQSLSVTYGDRQKGQGLGLNILNEKEGLFNRTHVIGSYAYSTPGLR